MSLDEWVKLLTVVQSLVTIVAIVVGGIWAYTKFIYRREKEPRAEFSVDLDFIGTQGNSWLVEVSAYVENKGLVRHPVRNFKLRLRYLCDDDQVIDGEENLKFQVLFPHSINERIGNLILAVQYLFRVAFDRFSASRSYNCGSLLKKGERE